MVEVGKDIPLSIQVIWSKPILHIRKLLFASSGNSVIPCGNTKRSKKNMGKIYPNVSLLPFQKQS